MYAVNEHDLGSFASGAVYSEKFLLPIPEALDSEHAAPLMCGGGMFP
jgi:D-arabinose 1-dehydrogenase-like Zn-dependent alcohol dehydrogenase